jgi:hypothetical protein
MDPSFAERLKYQISNIKSPLSNSKDDAETPTSCWLFVVSSRSLIESGARQ